MKQVEEINLLDEWIFPETEDPLVGLSVKIIDILASKVKEFNKTSSGKRVNISQLKQAFILGASSDEGSQDSDLLQEGFDRVNQFLEGRSKEFKKADFEIRKRPDSSFEIAYAKTDSQSSDNEVEAYNLNEYQINSIDELYLEDYKRSQIDIL